MRATSLIAFLAMFACSNQDADRVAHHIGPVRVVPPSGWLAAESTDTTTRTFTPPDNPRRESIVVIVGPVQQGSTARTLAQVKAAQAKLRDVAIDREQTVSTANGFDGRRLDLTFVAANGKRYARSHVALLAGNRIVHVLYTAQDPDPSRAALGTVLASLDTSSEEG